MNLGQMLHIFMADGKIKALLIVIFLDFLLGVIAAWKLGNFRLSYVSDFLRNDIAFKVIPYFILYAGAIVAGGQDIIFPGLDIGVVAGASYVVLMGAMVGSILSSVRDLGLQGQPQSVKSALAGSENAAPPKD